MFRSKFMSQINSSYGSGGMSISLNEQQFSSFIQHLKSEAGTELPIKKAACVIGRQPCEQVWVLGKELQVYNTIFNLYL